MQGYYKKSWLFYNYVWWDHHCTENKANGWLGEVLVNRWKLGHHTLSTVILLCSCSGWYELIDDDSYGIPLHSFFNTSSDGPHINKAVWRELNEEMKKRGYKGLLPFIACTLHIVHNAFHKGIVSLDQVEQLAFDLHAWVKQSPCKIEDFAKPAESTNLEDVSLFLRYVSTRWLTLSPALERIINRWDDAKKYFLDYLPRQQEYKRHLPKNKRYQRIVSSLKENEKETLIEIKFLVGVAPLFNKYLTVFQMDGPRVHCIFEQIKHLLLLLKKFIKPEVIKNSPKAKDLVAIDCSDASNQLPLNKIDFGPSVAGLAQKMKEDWRKKCLEVLHDSYVKMVRHLQMKLPLDSTLNVLLLLT